jgi:hypothetical protein
MHTPGPWSYFHDTCARCEREGTKEFVITGPPGGYHGQFSHEPDARLIAAAPDLLAALEAFLLLHKHSKSSPKNPNNTFLDTRDWETACADARAALSRAGKGDANG